MSEEKTEDEVREDFLNHIRGLINYWNNTDGSCKTKLEGLAFSILVTIDGCSGGQPGYILAPCPHPDDKQYLIDNDEDYYPENHEANVKCDISGGLHEFFAKKMEQLNK